MKKLIDYIGENYGGNQSAFARAHGLNRQQVQQYLTAKKPVHVIGNKLVQVIRDIE